MCLRAARLSADPPPPLGALTDLERAADAGAEAAFLDAACVVAFVTAALAEASSSSSNDGDGDGGEKSPSASAAAVLRASVVTAPLSAIPASADVTVPAASGGRAPPPSAVVSAAATTPDGGRVFDVSVIRGEGGGEGREASSSSSSSPLRFRLVAFAGGASWLEGADPRAREALSRGVAWGTHVDGGGAGSGGNGSGCWLRGRGQLSAALRRLRLLGSSATPKV